MTPPRVLVLDCWTRKALSVVRSLGRCGVAVDGVSHTRVAPPLYSRYTGDGFVTRHPAVDPEGYAEAILALVRSRAYDAVFPLEEASIAALIPHRAAIERHAALPLPASEKYAIATDKWSTIETAAKLGLPTPRTEHPGSLEQALDLAQSMGYPLAIKPRFGSGSRGFRRVRDESELRDYYDRVVGRFGNPILQEAIPWQGTGTGVGCLFDNGRQRISFSYKRLREFPVRGGPSTLRESTDDAVTKEYARTLLEALEWHGVAMVEFKTDPRDGTPKLMEINPRFWGSLELANAAGVNFPYSLLEVALHREVAQPAYGVGVRSRWLIPGDIAHFITNPQRFALDPSFFSFCEPATSLEEFAPDDIRGGVATVVCAALNVFSGEAWMLGGFR